MLVHYHQQDGDTCPYGLRVWIFSNGCTTGLLCQFFKENQVHLYMKSRKYIYMTCYSTCLFLLYENLNIAVDKLDYGIDDFNLLFSQANQVEVS